MKSLSRILVLVLITLFLSLQVNWSRKRVNFISQQLETSKSKLKSNILANGAIIASPSKSFPDYYYHWVRDAALVLGCSIDFLNSSSSIVWKTVDFSYKIQNTKTLSGLGEPKFNVDGQAFDGSWGRPQSDGPALRALSFIKLADLYLKNGGSVEFIKEKLYKPEIPAQSLVKKDLEYVSRALTENSFDLWEEINSKHHFFTRSVQWCALQRGSDFSFKMNDVGASQYYKQKSLEVALVLTEFWDEDLNKIKSTLEKITLKPSNLDSSTNEYCPENSMYPPFSEPILATAVKLLKQFDALYVINKQRYYVTGISPAVGRYPEDLYDGVSGKTGGNPWVLTTAAFANLYYILVARWKETGVILLLPSIKELALEYFYCTDKFPDEMSVRSRLGMHLVKNMTRFADGFLKRIQRHTDKDGSLSEQIHRETGKKHGAYDLTWSHVEVIRAIEARN